MNENILCCATLYLILVVTAIRCDGEEAGSASTVNKNRRGSSGLISMPRVGRGNVPWSFQASDEKGKRGSGDGYVMIPFPRVGRSDFLDGELNSNSGTAKSRRGSAGLIPMGRVGRGDIPWTFQISGLEDEKNKRGSSGMIPFPRVGRSDFFSHFPVPDTFFEEEDFLDGIPGKRGGGGSGSGENGLWFGPRLGKRSKRGAEYPWAVVTVKEFPGNRRYGGFTPRLGRESSENDEEDDTPLEEEEAQSVKNVRPVTNLKSHSFN